MTNKICEYTLRKTNKVIAEDGTVMLEPFLNANYNLSGNAVEFRINRSADDTGKTFIYTILPGNNEKNSMFLWVVLRAFVYKK